MIDANVLPFFVVGFFTWIIAFLVIAGLWASAKGDLETYFRREFPSEYSKLQPRLSSMEMFFGDPKTGIDQRKKDMILFGEEIPFDEEMISLQRKYRRWTIVFVGFPVATVSIIIATVQFS